MIFATSCAGCGRGGAVLCRTCRYSLVAPGSMAVGGEVIAAVPFAGRARDVVLGFKFRNRRALAHHFAGLLVNRLLAAGLTPDDFDVVTWAPTGSPRRQQRGYDQAELVAKRVAGQLGLPCRGLLRRDPSSGPQSGRDRAQRMHGPVFRGSPAVAGRRVLVIDDVVTTGSTLRSAEAALRAAGARSVQRAAVATTPALAPPTRHTSRDSRDTRRSTPDAVFSPARAA